MRFICFICFCIKCYGLYLCVLKYLELQVGTHLTFHIYFISSLFFCTFVFVLICVLVFMLYNISKSFRKKISFTNNCLLIFTLILHEVLISSIFLFVRMQSAMRMEEKYVDLVL